MNNGRQDNQRDKLYRNGERGLIAGVCAGLADFFGFHLTATRVLVAVGMCVFPSLIFLYILLAFLLPRRMPSRESNYDERLQRQVRGEPHATLSTVRHRFRDLDRRLQRLEKYVTSGRFRLDREFEGLKD